MEKGYVQKKKKEGNINHYFKHAHINSVLSHAYNLFRLNPLQQCQPKFV
jgi:hypothetical protein